MSRWHEPSCRRPDVTIEGGMPFCNYCFALATLEEDTSRTSPSIHSPPQFASPARMNLAWPSSVKYIHKIQSPDQAHELSTSTISAFENMRNPPKTSKSLQGEPGFPEIHFEDEIRLMRLKPGKPNDPIRADFELARLGGSSIPAYYALSYTWADEFGDSTRSCPIFTGPYWDVIYVTRRCDQAVRRLRTKQINCLIWIDSICISLDSITEKNHQTGLMREIYSNASRVIAYLGEASVDSTMALNFIKDTVTRFLISDHITAVDESHEKALTSLFARGYFTRLWIMQEIVLASDLEIMCGRDSILWPNLPLAVIFPGLPTPTWFSDRLIWRERSTHRIPYQILLHASAYSCTDPRDKVFGVLGLIGEQHLNPDYTLPIEAVYIGIAAYLVKNRHAFDVLALAGVREKRYSIPSWVPDWSQKLDAELLKAICFTEKVLDVDSAMIDLTSLVFEAATGSNVTVEVDGSTGSLYIQAVNLCKLSGQKFRANGQTKILMDRGLRGILVVSFSDLEYEFGEDYLFLLNGWNYPVILRYQPDSDSYLLVTACALAIGQSSGLCFLHWCESAKGINDSILVSEFSEEENSLILGFYCGLMELCSIQPAIPEDTFSEILPDVRVRILDLALLSLTRLRQIESRLRMVWSQLEQKLSWMFRDRIAVWQLFKEFSQGGRDCQGESKMQLELHEITGFVQFCGVEFQETIHWDLRQFCSSFLQSPALRTADFTNTWTPMLSQLKLVLPDIRQWMEVTEQLLQVFQYSNRVVGRRWLSFPGGKLPDKWLSCWKNFCKVIETGPGVSSQPVELDCYWDWAEFKDSMRLREQLWEQSIPQQIDPIANQKMAVHLGLRALGLDILGSGRLISII